MNGYTRSIDTDYGIGTILSHFDSNYIDHVVSDSLQMKFRPFNTPMPNMVDVLQRQLNSVKLNSPDYIEQVSSVTIDTYIEIIKKICAYYNLSFAGDFDQFDENQLYALAHTLYDIFISRFTEYMIDFFVSYIINNADSICEYLKYDDTAIKPKETGAYSPKFYVDPKFILIHANINKIIYNMTSYDIGLDQLLNYFLGPQQASFMIPLLVDNGDIFKNHYAYYILDQRYSSGVLTNVKLNLQSKTQEVARL